MPDQSIGGLLLQAHAQVAAQAHGEEFIHHNVSAMNCFEMALRSIEGAIQNVHNAEMHQRIQETAKSAGKTKVPA
jgi:hypothetical protein